MFTWQFLVSMIAGYAVVRTSCRLSATVRVLGVRRTLSGGVLMWRLRTMRPFASSNSRAMLRWPISPTVPIFFECQAILMLLVLTWCIGGTAAAQALLGSSIVISLAIWGSVHALESILPPCLLYLGVSEPGQYDSFRSLVRSRAWLTVSALDQDNPNVNSGEVSSGLFSELIFNDVLNGRVRGDGLLFRRLESIRTGDETWSWAVQQLINFVPLVIADLRSHSQIVCNELVWVLQADAAEKLLIITRDDGSTSIDLDMRSSGISTSQFSRQVTEKELNAAVAQTVDKMNCCSSLDRSVEKVTPHLAGVVASEILKATDQKVAWLNRLGDSNNSLSELDREIWHWAFGVVPGTSAPSPTRSLSAAVAVIRRRIELVSLSLHVGTDGTCWADVGVQPIPTSFRVSVSSQYILVDGVAKALLMALLNAELGIASGQCERPQPPLHRPPSSTDRLDSSIASHALLKRIIALDGKLDLISELALTSWAGIDSSGIRYNDEQTILDELEEAIAFAKRKGPYSIKILLDLNGRGVAEIARDSSFGWLIALSHAHGRPVWQRPSFALLTCVLKAECEHFDGLKR
jgi:hypothetical protein